MPLTDIEEEHWTDLSLMAEAVVPNDCQFMVIAFDEASLVIGGSVETKNLAVLLRKMADFVERENGGKRVKESFIDISHA